MIEVTSDYMDEEMAVGIQMLVEGREVGGGGEVVGNVDVG